MNDKITGILKEKTYTIPSYLLCNYKKLGISIDELIVMIYLINIEDYVLDYKKISKDINIDLKEVMGIVESLCEKKILEISLKKNKSSKFEENINLDLFYNKVFMSIINDDTTESSIYDKFEKEFGRTLSPIEYELISGWLSNGYKEEVILSALKEAIISGANNLKYIDRILFDWDKKGIDSIEKIEKNKKTFKKKDVTSVPDYDWLDE